MKVSRREFTAVAAASLAAGCASAGAGPSGQAGRGPIAEIAYGRVRGVRQDDGIYVFKGIPYGDTTAGAHRFMPPRPPQAWAGVRDALTWSVMAPQNSAGANPVGLSGAVFAEYFGSFGEALPTQSEDCLQLNVFTPALRDGRKRPVMVWLHGGGFSSGSGAGARSDGSNLARKHHVVTVSVNHRLNVFGYCDLSAYGERFANTGAVGQLDIVAALEWVRDNIEAFGGDPSNVMVHGESGGSAKTSILLAMPAARGLFSRAICQSGVANILPSREEGQAMAARLLREMQLDGDTIAQLQQAPPEQILAAAARVVAGNPAWRGRARDFSPTIGGPAIPVAPLAAVAAGSARDIALIVGCTKHEASLFLSGAGINPATLTNAQLDQMAPAMLGAQGSALLAGYRANHPSSTPGDLVVRAMTDVSMRFPSIALAEAHVRGGGAATRMYLFTWESPRLPDMHSGHGIDGTFYFDNTETVPIAAGNLEAQALAGAVSTAWTNFARNGVPSAPGLPDWPSYSLEQRETMILAASPHVENDPMQADRLMQARIQ